MILKIWGVFALLHIFTTAQQPLCEPTGGCIINLPVGDVPSNPYIVSEIVDTDTSCQPFKKTLRVYGMLLLVNTAGQTVPENGLKWIAHSLTELFPASASDQVGQKKVLQAMFQYRAANPVFSPKFINDMSPARDYISLCDSLTIYFEETANNPSAQIMEVYEHFLHIITNVGLNQAFPDKWGISKTSDLYNAMQEAITKKVYDVSSYANADDEARIRLEMQEFAYWGLSAATGMQETYVHESMAPEWTLKTPSDVESNLPLFWKLHTETTATWMGRISDATLVQLGNLAPGGDEPTAAPWPIIAPLRGDVSGDTNMNNLCAEQTTMPAGMTCGGASNNNGGNSGGGNDNKSPSSSTNGVATPSKSGGFRIKLEHSIFLMLFIICFFTMHKF
jgi:hypothetical protein